MPRSASVYDRVIARRIKEGRVEAGLSQPQLAKGIKTSYQQVQKYENATNRASAGTLYEISKLINVTMDFFYHDMEEAAVKLLREDQEKK